MPWGDGSTAFYSTGSPNIEVSIRTSPRQISQMKSTNRLGWLLGLGVVQKIMKDKIGRSVQGPTKEHRERDEMNIFGEVRNAAGRIVTMRMRTPEGYTFTVDSSLACVKKLLEKPMPPGAYTPSMAFGP